MIQIQINRQLGNFRVSAQFESQTRGVVALFGQSGSGKTSIVNMIAGLLTPDSGRIKIDGRVLFDSDHKINLKIHERRIGYVFQESRLFPHLSIRSNLNYGRKRAPENARQIEFDEVIGVLGIGHLMDQKPRTLSAWTSWASSLRRPGSTSCSILSVSLADWLITRWISVSPSLRSSSIRRQPKIVPVAPVMPMIILFMMGSPKVAGRMGMAYRNTGAAPMARPQSSERRITWSGA